MIRGSEENVWVSGEWGGQEAEYCAASCPGIVVLLELRLVCVSLGIKGRKK